MNIISRLCTFYHQNSSHDYSGLSSSSLTINITIIPPFIHHSESCSHCYTSTGSWFQREFAVRCLIGTVPSIHNHVTTRNMLCITSIHNHVSTWNMLYIKSSLETQVTQQQAIACTHGILTFITFSSWYTPVRVPYRWKGLQPLHSSEDYAGH